MQVKMMELGWLLHTHLRPDGLGQLAQVLRGRLGLAGMRSMAVDLGVCWMLANMVRRDAGGRRGLLVGSHGSDGRGDCARRQCVRDEGSAARRRRRQR